MKKHHIVLDSSQTNAKRRRWLSDGGLVYVKRDIDHSCINVFRFKIVQSKAFDIWIGLERKAPRHEWWFRARDGTVYESDQEDWKPYADVLVKEGDVVKL